jgi:hypothetical protein
MVNNSCVSLEREREREKEEEEEEGGGIKLDGFQRTKDVAVLLQINFSD